MNKIQTLLMLALMSLYMNGQSDYFQQEVNTYIEVRLDDKNHHLYAFERIEYINNSPDDLEKIILHIWPNAYRNNTSEMATQLDENGEIDFHFADSFDRGYLDSLNFKIDGTPVTFDYYQEELDIIEIKLPSVLKSGDKITIETPFFVKIPKGIYSRLGHIKESYQVTQWFPKPAVYDKNGWHPLPYLSQGEFYSEYGSYDVKITVPQNYVVGATGDLVNGDEELAFLEAKVKATEEMIEKNTVPRNKMGYPIVKEIVSDTLFKTLHFHQDNVHDFAWFADKRYHVLKGEVELPHSGRKVTTWAMFTNNEFDLWKRSIEYLNDATYYYSLWTGDYPYNHVTAVDGSISAGGGMEYPNITVIGESYTDLGLEQVIVHEVGHNWFYGILGSNERVNAWMDEGLNTFTENRYTETKYPDSKMDFGISQNLMNRAGLDGFGPRGIYDLGYIYNARRNYDQPIQTNSEDFTPTNYGAIVYGKTGIGFDYLLAYLGDSLFDKCMLAYFDKWKFKHPQPDDIRKIFEEVSGKDLTWLFDDYIKTTEKINYSMCGVKIISDSAYIKIRNKGDISTPLSITGSIEGIIGETFWFEGFEGTKTVSVPYKGEDLYVIDLSRDMPTVFRKDDEIETQGLLKTLDPIKLKFLGSFEKSDENHIYYAPLLGWNGQDNFMLGLSLYNSAFPEKKLEWLVAPMYGFGSNNITGVGDVKWNISFNEGMFRKITLGYNFKSFSSRYDLRNGGYFYSGTDPEIYESPRINNWYRNQAGLDIEIRNGLRNAKHTLTLNGIMLHENISLIENDITQAIKATYSVKNRQVLKPATLNFNVIGLNSEKFGSFAGISLEAKIRKNYNVDLKGIELRLFAGQTLSRNEVNMTSKYNWSLTGQRGVNDYLFEHTLLGRYQQYPDMTIQQNTETHGNFKTNTWSNIGSNDQWIISLNMKAEVPFRIPIGVFADAGMHPITVISNGLISKEVRAQYDLGIYLPIYKDRFEIYVPLLFSQDIKDQINYQGISFLQRIRFTLSFDELNPFKIVREIKP